ncbi:unnamed protein product [Arctogadus glacialis]
MMDHIIHWVRVDPSELGRTKLPGDEPMNSMAVPMMLLSLVQQLTEERDQDLVEKYRETSHWCVQKILQHIQQVPEKTCNLLSTLFRRISTN